ncbi:MAG: SpoIIE family protein phosphatase [Oscillospiraceae bacterium]|nr:SpoIIE family protein phosphatase [Oscillospiraceae bacterium]
MKIIKGLKLGGLQQKIFNLVLVFILILIAVYAAVAVWQQRNLTQIVQEASVLQQSSITEVSEETMEAVLRQSMTQITALQGYIADDLFSDVRTDVLTLRAFAEELFENRDLFPPRTVAPPSSAMDGKASAMLICSEDADPSSSELLGLVGNMGEIMLSMYEASGKLSSVFIGTADGNMVLVNDRAGAYLLPDGKPRTLEILNRPWYLQAAAAGEPVFTGVELDAYTNIPMLECAAPVYHEGQLVAVVSADIFLDSISNYVERATSEGGFLCVIDGNGRVLFSSMKDGPLQAQLAKDAPDLRENSNPELARFVTLALRENTGLELIMADGQEFYMTAAPLPSVGWSILSGVEKEVTRQPTAAMLTRYDAISAEALESYELGARHSTQLLLTATAVILLLATASALIMAKRTVKPLERMTQRINALRDGDTAFEMEDAYRTGDEIETLAESFATLSARTRNYITQITRITAEKERIGTELALATRIQADMLPNIFPAFPDRPDFDIYATMDPAKEVGGDFYDFFLIDRDHLALVMADVSGKGVPAALFMMISKILVQNYMLNGYSPAETMKVVNEQICANNREDMFVTAWLGILDLRTGVLTAANAGHEYPVLMQAGGSFEPVKSRHGLVLGGMAETKYTDRTLTLTPGAKLFLYTDGVPEATNAENKLFGIDRMLIALNRDTSLPPEAVIRQVREAVDDFVQDAEQFDDLTMLCLEYKGSGSAAGKPDR